MNKLKDYFSFNKKERNGILLLSFVLVFLIIFYQFQYLLSVNRTTDFSEFEQAITKLEYADAKQEEIKKDGLFLFNPNDLNDAGWLALGLSQAKLKVLRNYQKSGGFFTQAQELKKCFAISKEFYNQIKEYVIIPNPKKPKSKNQQAITQNQIVELNTADSLALISIKGIGPFYTKQILKYRKQLGGFIYYEQFTEIWGLENLELKDFKQQTIIDTLYISKTNINTATIETLRHHPYLNYKQAKMIVNYREQHGNYQQLKDICKIKPISPELFRKIAPYFKIHD